MLRGAYYPAVKYWNYINYKTDKIYKFGKIRA